MVRVGAGAGVENALSECHQLLAHELLHLSSLRLQFSLTPCDPLGLQGCEDWGFWWNVVIGEFGWREQSCPNYRWIILSLAAFLCWSFALITSIANRVLCFIFLDFFTSIVSLYFCLCLSLSFPPFALSLLFSTFTSSPIREIMTVFGLSLPELFSWLVVWLMVLIMCAFVCFPSSSSRLHCLCLSRYEIPTLNSPSSNISTCTWSLGASIMFD